MGPNWQDAKFVLCKMWIMLVGPLLRLIWLQRNRVKRRGHKTLHWESVVEQAMLLWACQIRIWLSQDEVDDLTRDTALRVLDRMASKYPYTDFWAKHPRAMDPRAMRPP